MAKRVNRADLTLRNLRALKARLSKLEKVVSSLDRDITRLLGLFYSVEAAKR